MKLRNFVLLFLISNYSGSLGNEVNSGNESCFPRSFVIDYENDQFLKDGLPFRYISGSIHYFRVPRIYWKDRLSKLVAAGFNTVQTYIEWSLHEPYHGSFNFEDDLDFISYIKLAQELGLLVIIRPGPYICAERDMGGLPSWLLKENPSMSIRSSDPTYLKFVDAWLSKLLPLLKPLLYSNGGPIISVQVENEYGGYTACDKSYMSHLRDLFRAFLGDEVVLFTTDAARDQNISCGSVDGVYITVDFEPTRNATDAFQVMRKYQPNGPLVNSELYPGWLDHWSFAHTRTFSSIQVITSSLEDILSLNASVNLYMFHGGTSFGFANGANLDDNYYKSDPTSYDYNAPLSEAGDPTEKYFAIRKLISKFAPVPVGPVPGPVRKFAYGPVTMKPVSYLFSILPQLSFHFSIYNEFPLTFETLGQAYGFVLYETYLNDMFMDPVLLRIPKIRDRGIVFLDEVVKGILSRQDNLISIPLKVNPGQKLSILVENQGRITYGSEIKDPKGIVSNVTLGSKILIGWNHTCLHLNNTRLLRKILYYVTNTSKENKLTKYSIDGNVLTPSFFKGNFQLPQSSPEAQDTFLAMNNWSKGVVFVNGFNLGRYWSAVGPQYTLYVPKSNLKDYPEDNELIILELEEAPCSYKMKHNAVEKDCQVEFVSEPNIDGPTPYGYEGVLFHDLDVSLEEF